MAVYLLLDERLVQNIVPASCENISALKQHIGKDKLKQMDMVVGKDIASLARLLH